MAVLLFFSACALPTPVPRSFVEDRELLAAELGQQALTDFQMGRYIDAELGFRQVLYIFPNAESPRFNLANTLARGGLFDEAEIILKGLESENPDEPKYISARAGLYYRAGKYDEALETYRQIMSHAEEKKLVAAAGDAARNIAVISFLLGDATGALCYSTEALESGIVNREDVIRHARFLLALNRIEDASMFLSDYFKVPANQKDGYALHLFSLVQYAKGLFDEAYQYNKRAGIFIQGNQDLDFEVKLMGVALHGLTELGRKDFMSDDPDEQEKKEEERLRVRGEVLDDRRAAGPSGLYWPVRFQEGVLLLLEQYRAEKEAEANRGLIPDLDVILKNIIPW